VTYLIQLVLALLGVVDGRLVPVVEEVPSSNETITTVVAGTTSYQYPLALVQRLKLEDYGLLVRKREGRALER
jgi:hypothetical protein